MRKLDEQADEANWAKWVRMVMRELWEVVEARPEGSRVLTEDSK
jgi:hypothetical protein